MEDIQLAQNVDISKISFGAVKELDNGGKVVPILYEGKNRLVIQLPEMTSPYKLNKWDKGPVRYDISVSLRGAEERPSVKATLTLAQQLDKLVVEGAVKNKSWLKNPLIKNVDGAMPLYTPILKYSKDKDTGIINEAYPPTLKMGLAHKNDIVTVPCYNKDAELMDIHDAEKNGEIKGSAVTGIVQLGSVWFAGQKFGVKLNAVQLRIVPRTGIVGYAIQDDSNDRVKESSDKEDSDDEIITNQKDKPSTNIDNSDDDDDDDDDDEEDNDDDEDNVAESTAKPLKKVIKKVLKK
jgi:hypothetical protein